MIVLPKINKEVPVLTIKRIMNKNVSKNIIISKDSLVYLSDFIERLLIEITKEAETLAKFSGRKTILKKDIEFVLEDIEKILKNLI